MAQYNVKLDYFEGPLDLLLHLVNKAEVDIYDIPVAIITDQYMDYIHTMKQLELDIASEYLVMAATLLVIKSKMLLPKHEEPLFDDGLEQYDEDDPREELITRLIEYRKYKEAAKNLKERELEQALLYSKSPTDLRPYIEEMKNEPQPINASIYDMLDAFSQLLKRKALTIPKQTKIHREDYPIERKMEEVILQLYRFHGKTTFSQLFQYEEKSQLVVTFLALLELMKEKKIVCEQSNNFNDISISLWGEDIFVE